MIPSVNNGLSSCCFHCFVCLTGERDSTHREDRKTTVRQCLSKWSSMQSAADQNPILCLLKEMNNGYVERRNGPNNWNAGKGILAVSNKRKSKRSRRSLASVTDGFRFVIVKPGIVPPLRKRGLRLCSVISHKSFSAYLLCAIHIAWGRWSGEGFGRNQSMCRESHNKIHVWSSARSINRSGK